MMSHVQLCPAQSEFPDMLEHLTKEGLVSLRDALDVGEAQGKGLGRRGKCFRKAQVRDHIEIVQLCFVVGCAI